MQYLEKVPLDVNLTLVMGTDDTDAEPSSLSYSDACCKLNDWNRGRFHPDLWIEVYYFEYGRMQDVMILWDDAGQFVDSLYFVAKHL